jgi:hypothetical protein
MPARKIATCCYCGTRAVLVLRGKDRHELSCSRCGAPLHTLKMLPIGPECVTGRGVTSPRPKPKPVHPKQPHPKARKVKKTKKRKGLLRYLAEEVWDEIEDIFD